MRCVMWRAGCILTNRGQLRWINDWIIQWRRHRYHRWCKLIYLWVTFLTIKAPVITISVMWRAVWLLNNLGQLRWIDDWTIQWKRNRYQRWWNIFALLVTVLSIKSPVITRSCSITTLIVPYSTFVATANTLWTWHDECKMSMWWCCVHVILFVNVHQRVRAKFLARQLQSCLRFITRNKIEYEPFVSI